MLLERLDQWHARGQLRLALQGGGQLGHWRWQAQLIAPNDGPPADGPQADAGDEEHECRDNNPKLRVVRQEVWKPDTEHGQAHGKRHGCDLGHVGMVGAGTVIACAAVASHPARAVGQRGISDCGHACAESAHLREIRASMHAGKSQRCVSKRDRMSVN